MNSPAILRQHVTTEARTSYPDVPYGGQQFRHPRTSYGVAGHWLHLLAVLSPLVIGEVIKDPDKKWRAIRLASVGTALASEALWAHRVMKQKEKAEEACQR
jgi:hypothetical protein